MGGLMPILLADDSRNDVELAVEALTGRLANQVVTVSDGVEALDYLFCRGRFEGRPDGLPAVVLLDIHMPRMDGLEVLGRIRADARLASLAVIMLTSSREERHIVESYQHRVNGYLVKPIDFRTLMETVRALGLSLGVLDEPPTGKRAA
jgi:two-component system response regulator